MNNTRAICVFCHIPFLRVGSPRIPGAQASLPAGLGLGVTTACNDGCAPRFKKPTRRLRAIDGSSVISERQSESALVVGSHPAVGRVASFSAAIEVSKLHL